MGLGAEIIAIEDSDTTGWLESATTVGEVNFRSVQSLVDAVLGALGTRKLSLLHIQAHGNPSGIAIGSDWVSVASFTNFRSALDRLTPKFTSGAWVDLRACNVGQNLPLMRLFHGLWGAGIVAGRGSQNNLFDANFGFYQIISPDGTESRSFSVPPWVSYDTTRRGIRAITSRIF